MSNDTQRSSPLPCAQRCRPEVTSAPAVSPCVKHDVYANQGRELQKYIAKSTT